MEDGVGILHRYYYFPNSFGFDKSFLIISGRKKKFMITNICYCEFSTVDEFQRVLRAMDFVDFANTLKV